VRKIKKNTNMKTFDLAVEHLKDLDLKSFPIVIKDINKYVPNENFVSMIHENHKEFLADKRNNISNDHYKGLCYTTALNHLIFKFNGWVSFFYVACEIVEAYKYVLDTDFEPYLRTVYPKVMLDEWFKYCENLKAKTEILEGELTPHYFFVAYHYIIETH